MNHIDTFAERYSAILQLFAEYNILELCLQGCDSTIAFDLTTDIELPKIFADPKDYLDWIFEFIDRSEIPINFQTPFGGGLSECQKFRWHIVIPPMAHPFPIFSMRKIQSHVGTALFDICETDKSQLANILESKATTPVLIAGPTFSGKSTFLSALLQQHCSNERVCVLETLPELPLTSPKWFRLSTQRGLSTRRQHIDPMLECLANALRMRPDRIVVGEIRTSQELEAFESCRTTGHKSSLGTIHAGSVSECLQRINSLDIKRQLSGDLFVILLSRGSPPRITEIKHTTLH